MPAGGLSIAKIVSILAVMAIVLPLLAYLSTMYNGASGSTLQTYSTNSQSVLSILSNNVTGMVNSAVQGYSTNSSGNAAAQSFAYAFIIPNFGKVFTTIMNAPKTISTTILMPLLGILFGNLAFPAGGIASTTVQNLGTTITGVLTLFISFWALSLWFKLPAWSLG